MARADALRARYPAALIDEFQDTDPLQFAIFDRIFAAGRGSGPLFLVGDPEAGDLQLPSGRSSHVPCRAACRLGALYARRQPAFDGADRRCVQSHLRRESARIRPRRARLPACARRRAFIVRRSSTMPTRAYRRRGWRRCASGCCLRATPHCSSAMHSDEAAEACAAEIVRLLRGAREGECRARRERARAGRHRRPCAHA